jgi:hypothetical protein
MRCQWLPLADAEASVTGIPTVERTAERFLSNASPRSENLGGSDARAALRPGNISPELRGTRNRSFTRLAKSLRSLLEGLDVIGAGWIKVGPRIASVTGIAFHISVRVVVFSNCANLDFWEVFENGFEDFE